MIKLKKSTLLLVGFLSFFMSCKKEVKKRSYSDHSNTAAAWESLMDPDKWRGFQQDSLPNNWHITDSLISFYGTELGQGGDIISVLTYANFELKWQWKISPQGNSGVFYHVIESSKYSGVSETAPEYQLIDDLNFPTPLEDWQKTGANYAMHIANSSKILKPVGTWNTSQIIFNKGQVSHYLNGKLIVSFSKNTNDWLSRKNSGKWKDYPDYGKANEGHLALQDHGSGVWFREVQIKNLGE